MLLWADGQWTTLLANWTNPFRQHDVVDFAHHLLQQTNPLFLSCCWESRLEDDGQLKVVDHNAQGCPLRLYICSEQKRTLPIDLQGLVSSWSLASFGLRALTEPADVTCLHIDRFDSKGRKSHTRLTWDSKVWLPYFLNTKLEVDHIPFSVLGVSFHLGSEASSGHYNTAIKDGDSWWVYDDDHTPVKFSTLPLVAQENCCLLWLNCTPHGGAEEISPFSEESPILTDNEKVQHIIHDPAINDDWNNKWLLGLDLMDTDLLVDHPRLCHRLVKKCIMCGSWPRDLISRMQVAHRSMWEAAGSLAEQCAVSFLSKAHPTRWCACQPFHSIGLNEDHCCPCLRQFAMLHMALRSHQRAEAKASTLARLLGKNFS